MATQIKLNQVNQESASTGQAVVWNGANWAPGSVTAGSAQSLTTVCKNMTGSPIVKGTIVYLNGANGTHPTIAKAKADAESTSAGTFGVVVTNIANSGTGEVLNFGTLTDLDIRTNAPSPITADTLSAGDSLYLSPTTAGYITNVKPAAPNHVVFIGTLTTDQVTNAKIVYRIHNGFELEELHNVNISSVANKDILRYDSTNPGLWKNTTLTTAIGQNGMVGINTVEPTAYLDVADSSTNTITKGVSILSGSWTSTGWTGSFPSFTHTSGNTSVLSSPFTVPADITFIETNVTFTAAPLTEATYYITNTITRNGTVNTPTGSSGNYTGTISFTDTSYFLVGNTITVTGTGAFTAGVTTITAITSNTSISYSSTSTAITAGAITAITQKYSTIGATASSPSLIHGFKVAPSSTGTINIVPTSTFTGTTLGVSVIPYNNKFSPSQVLRNSSNVIVSSQRAPASPSNLFIGTKAGEVVNNGLNNIVLGNINTSSLENSGENLTDGSNNVFIGSGTGPRLSSGSNNLFLGDQAGAKALGGNNNLFVGATSGYQFNYGIQNSAIGTAALSNLVTGSFNVGIGQSAGSNLVTGSGNTAIGVNSTFSSTTPTNQTVIGWAAVGNGDNTVTIGNSSNWSTFFKGPTISAGNALGLRIQANTYTGINIATASTTAGLYNVDIPTSFSLSSRGTLGGTGGNDIAIPLNISNFDYAPTAALTTVTGFSGGFTADLVLNQAAVSAGSGWTGTLLTTGYTHSSGTASLIPCFIDKAAAYVISISTTSRTLGSYNIYLGGTLIATVTTNTVVSYYKIAGTSADFLEIVPTTDFNGAVSISVYKCLTGRIVNVKNTSANNILLKNNNTSSSVANRFNFGYDIVIKPGKSLMLTYGAFVENTGPVGWELFTPNNANIPVNNFPAAVTVDTTLGFSDLNNVVRVSSTAALKIRIPKDGTSDLPIGSQIDILRYNTGTVFITGAIAGTGIAGTIGSLAGVGPWTATVTVASGGTAFTNGSQLDAVAGLGSFRYGSTCIVSGTSTATAVPISCVGFAPVAGGITGFGTTARIYSANNQKKIASQYGIVSAIKVAADEWVLVGNLGA